MTLQKLPGSVAMCALAVTISACSGATPLSTASILGGGSAAGATPAIPAAPASTPQSRALRVGAVAARAVKCGYNFDPTNLRAGFLAFESTAGTPPDQLPTAEKAYDAAFSGVGKAIAGDKDYCTNERTKSIKADLTRHLAGDFTEPRPKAAKVAAQSGIFGSFYDPDCADCNKKFNADTYYDVTGRPKGSPE